MRGVYRGEQVNLIFYRHRFPVAVIRFTRHEGTAHLLAQAVMKEIRTPEWDKMMREVALITALRTGCDLLFATGVKDDEREYYRTTGFVDSGSIVSYAELGEQHEDNDQNESVAQPVLVI
jgi:hypothetical protein